MLLVSPADETPVDPCDAHADEMDLAIAIDRLEQATSIQVKRIEHKWAGLRTFAPDKEFIVGFDPRAEGFFWLAGQGGYGVQSAPGLTMLASALVCDSTLPAHASALLNYRDVISPERLLAD